MRILFPRLLLGPSLVLFFAAFLLARTANQSLEVNGRQREYLIHVPERLAAGDRAALVIAFHGGASNPVAMEHYCGLSLQADASGFIVVYPAGTGLLPRLLTWNAGGCCGYAEKNRVDDVAFVRRLIGDICQRYPVDAGRVYLTGISNGAMMAYRAAAELPEQIAAVAAVSGTLACDPGLVRQSVPVLHFHGDADAFAPYNGGRGDKTLSDYSHRSVAENMEFWRKVNGCGDKPEVSPLPARADDGTQVLCHTWRTPAGEARVVLYEIIGGGHTWPGTRSDVRRLGPVTQQISANERMWQFFSKFRK